MGEIKNLEQFALDRMPAEFRATREAELAYFDGVDDAISLRCLDFGKHQNSRLAFDAYCYGVSMVNAARA